MGQVRSTPPSPPPRQSPWANGQIATGKIDGKGEIPRERVGTERNWVQDPPPRPPKRVVLVADYGGGGRAAKHIIDRVPAPPCSVDWELSGRRHLPAHHVCVKGEGMVVNHVDGLVYILICV